MREALPVANKKERDVATCFAIFMALWILVFFFINHPHPSLWSILMLIGLGAPTLAGPLSGM
jgi:hypothetical protein